LSRTKTLKVEGATAVRIKGRETIPVVHYIKEWRKHAGLSVEKLGEIAGISGSMISQLERGKTTYTQNTLEALARALHLQAWQLLACGPDENKELWRMVMNTPERRTLLLQISDSDRPTMEKLLANSVEGACDAAVKTARSIFVLKPETELTAR
jgi:transcriptional regulator with XRE-family HTH domain